MSLELPSSDRMAGFLREKAAFERLKASLRTQYQGKYVAIHGGRVVDSDTDVIALIRRFRKDHPSESVYIDGVGLPPDAILAPFTFIGSGRSGCRDISERHDDFLFEEEPD